MALPAKLLQAPDVINRYHARFRFDDEIVTPCSEFAAIEDNYGGRVPEDMQHEHQHLSMQEMTWESGTTLTVGQANCRRLSGAYLHALEQTKSKVRPSLRTIDQYDPCLAVCIMLVVSEGARVVFLNALLSMLFPAVRLEVRPASAGMKLLSTQAQHGSQHQATDPQRVAWTHITHTMSSYGLFTGHGFPTTIPGRFEFESVVEIAARRIKTCRVANFHMIWLPWGAWFTVVITLSLFF